MAPTCDRHPPEIQQTKGQQGRIWCLNLNPNQKAKVMGRQQINSTATFFTLFRNEMSFFCLVVISLKKWLCDEGFTPLPCRSRCRTPGPTDVSSAQRRWSPGKYEPSKDLEVEQVLGLKDVNTAHVKNYCMDLRIHLQKPLLVQISDNRFEGTFQKSVSWYLLISSSTSTFGQDRLFLQSCKVEQHWDSGNFVCFSLHIFGHDVHPLAGKNRSC